MNEAAPTKLCIACGEPIPAGSYVCSKCNEYQSRWRNEVRYFATVAGFLTLVFSGLAFSAGLLKSGWDYKWPPALIVLEYDTFGSITFVNPSNQFVLVKYFGVRAAYPGNSQALSKRWDINQSVDPSRSLSIDLVKLANTHFRGLEKTTFGNAPGPYAQKVSEKDKKEIFAYKRYKEYFPAFLMSKGTEHRHLVADVGKYILTFPCTAELSYLFLQSQAERIEPLPCVGFIRHAPTVAK